METGRYYPLELILWGEPESKAQISFHAPSYASMPLQKQQWVVDCFEQTQETLHGSNAD